MWKCATVDTERGYRIDGWAPTTRWIAPGPLERDSSPPESYFTLTPALSTVLVVSNRR